MRWNPPSGRVQLILLSPVLVPLAIVAIPVVGAILTYERWGPQAKWRTWFAWRPVKAEPPSGQPFAMRWVWLERVEKFSGYSAVTAYRLLPTTTDREEQKR